MANAGPIMVPVINSPAPIFRDGKWHRTSDNLGCAVGSFLEHRFKAIATWRWHNFAMRSASSGRTPLRINLDETAICLYQGGRRGNIFLSDGAPAVEHVSLGKRRKYMSHIAVICDVPHIQPLLPQTLVCNERTIPANKYVELRDGMPPNVYLVRQRSAWNNTAS